MFSRIKKRFRTKRQEALAVRNDPLYKRHGGEKVLFAVMFVIFVLFAVSFIFPFLWVLMNSFKNNGEFFRGNFLGLPKDWTFSNYIEAFQFREQYSGFTIFQMLGMSVLIAGLGTIVTVFTSSSAAYVVAKYKFPGRSLIFAVVMFSLIVPIVGALPSQVQLMESLGLKDTVIGCIFLYSGGFGMNFLLLYSFFKNLSWSYVEAGYIDGASDVKIFFKIIIPLAKGPIIAITIIQLIGLWNDYITPSIYLPDMPTIAVGLNYMTTQLLETYSLYTVVFAAIVIALLPIIVVFCCFSKTIMENTTVGGLKG